MRLRVRVCVCSISMSFPARILSSGDSLHQSVHMRASATTPCRSRRRAVQRHLLNHTSESTLHTRRHTHKVFLMIIIFCRPSIETMHESQRSEKAKTLCTRSRVTPNVRKSQQESSALEPFCHCYHCYHYSFLSRCFSSHSCLKYWNATSAHTSYCHYWL